MTELDKQLRAEKSLGAQAIGLLLREIGRKSPKAAELIEQDLANPDMGLAQCYQALEQYARERQQGGCWACPVIGLDTENEAVKVILGFYKIPSDWVRSGADRSDDFDLMDWI